jgi:hypothetical protein
MSFSHTHTRGFSNGATTISSSETFTGDSEVNIDTELAASSTNVDHNVAIDVSELESLFMLAEADATVYVNDASTGSPSATIALEGGRAYVWPNGSATNPLGATDVTSLYITCSAGGDFQMRALQDPTP